MNKVQKMYHWIKEDALRYGKASPYSQAKLNLLQKALCSPIIKDNYLYIGDIELEFLRAKDIKIEKNRKPKEEWVYLDSPRECIKYRL